MLRGALGRSPRQRFPRWCSYWCAAIVTSPVDMAKTRIMNSSRGDGKYTGVLQTLTHIARTEGITALYKGFNSQWLRIGPHTMITLMIFENLRKLAGMDYL